MLFRDLDGPLSCAAGSVVCIGAFDGLHLGHQALVRRAVERARALRVPAVAVTFEPLPREYFAAGAKPPRLTLARALITRPDGASTSTWIGCRPAVEDTTAALRTAVTGRRTTRFPSITSTYAEPPSSRNAPIGTTTASGDDSPTTRPVANWPPTIAPPGLGIRT